MIFSYFRKKSLTVLVTTEVHHSIHEYMNALSYLYVLFEFNSNSSAKSYVKSFDLILMFRCWLF